MTPKWLLSATLAIVFWTLPSAQASPGPVELRAKDGVLISGLVYEAVRPKAIIPPS